MKSCLTSYLRFAWRLDSLLCIKRNNLTKPKSSLTATIKRKIKAFKKKRLKFKKAHSNLLKFKCACALLCGFKAHFFLVVKSCANGYHSP